MTRHERAFLTAGVHYIVSLGVGLLAFAAAWGTGLSDAYHGDSGLRLFTVLLVILQAPVALLQFVVTHLRADRTGLPAQAILLLAIPSSLLYGYLITHFWKRYDRKT